MTREIHSKEVWTIILTQLFGERNNLGTKHISNGENDWLEKIFVHVNSGGVDRRKMSLTWTDLEKKWLDSDIADEKGLELLNCSWKGISWNYTELKWLSDGSECYLEFTWYVLEWNKHTPQRAEKCSDTIFSFLASFLRHSPQTPNISNSFNPLWFYTETQFLDLICIKSVLLGDQFIFHRCSGAGLW